MNIIETVKNKFTAAAVYQKAKSKAFVSIKASLAIELLHFLIKSLGGRLSTISGVDTRSVIELHYHIAFDKDGLLLTVQTTVNKDAPVINTLADFLGGAEWIEREVHEMLGVNFIGHPQMERLLLPDDWPNGVFPHRKQSFASEKENEERPVN